MIMNRKAAEFWWNLKREGEKFVPPRNVAHYEKKSIRSLAWGGEEPKWKPVTWEEVFRKRTERINHIIEMKRLPSQRVKPCFIWVFYQKHFPFVGWWIYIKFNGMNDVALNFRDSSYSGIIKKIRDHFPSGKFQEFESNSEWCEFFAKKYPHKGFKRNRKQGLYKARAVLNSSDRIIDILL